MLFGSALFVIPGIGPLFAAGPLVAWIIAGLEGATVVGGMSALGAGLFSIGIPKNSVLSYETQIKAGKFVVIAHGPRDELAKGRAVLAGATQYEREGAQTLRVMPLATSRFSDMVVFPCRSFCSASGLPLRARHSMARRKARDMKIRLKDFRVPGGEKTRLKEWATDIGPLYKSEKQYKELLTADVEELSALQRLLYATNGYRCS